MLQLEPGQRNSLQSAHADGPSINHTPSTHDKHKTASTPRFVGRSSHGGRLRSCHERHRASLTEFESLRAEQKVFGKRVAVATGPQKQELLAQVKELSARVKELDATATEAAMLVVRFEPEPGG